MSDKEPGKQPFSEQAGEQSGGQSLSEHGIETRYNSETHWFSQIEDLSRADLTSARPANSSSEGSAHSENSAKSAHSVSLKNRAKRAKPNAEPSAAARLKKSLKSALKKATHSRRTDYEKLEERVKQFQAVSFDVFDTALFRRCGEPHAIFDIVAQSCEVSDFVRRRIEAEQCARKIHGKRTNLEHIYECLELPLEKSDGTRDAMRMILKEMELNAERSNLRAKPEILRLYRQAAEAGIRVAFISDMYLPSEFLRKILVTAGYKGLENSGFADAADSVSGSASGSVAGSVSGSASASAKSGSASAEPGQPQFVIVSCEEGEEKTDGGLFKAAIEKHGWTKNSLHIGDSIRHDLIGARRAGIKSCLINRY